MSNIYGPILPLQLDSRNTAALVRAIQTRINLESGGVLNDFTPASPLSAISEGQAFAQSELLYYLNNLPEAFTLQWLRQLGIQRRVGARALVDVTFFRTPGYNKVIIIPVGTKVYSTSGLAFVLTTELKMLEAEFSKVGTCRSDRWGAVYNVGSGQINKIERNFLGLESLTNLEAAAGGKDLEFVSDMKQRAFEVLGRRNLTTALDFENEMRTLAPEGSILKVLTYEERFNLSPQFSGNVVICAGSETGAPLSDSTIQYVLDSMRGRVIIGTNLSIISPEVVPVEAAVEVYYDPTRSGGLDAKANDILEFLKDYVNPTSIPLGSSLLYEEALRRLYNYDFVKSVNNLNFNILARDESVLDGICAGFVGVEDEVNSKCIYTPSAIVNSDNQSNFNSSPVTSYKLYNAYITFTSTDTYSPLTYSYNGLYTL